MDVVEKDVKTSGGELTTGKARQRTEWNEWRSVVGAVKAGTRLYHQYDDNDDYGVVDQGWYQAVSPV